MNRAKRMLDCPSCSSSLTIGVGNADYSADTEILCRKCGSIETVARLKRRRMITNQHPFSLVWRLSRRTDLDPSGSSNTLAYQETVWPASSQTHRPAKGLLPSPPQPGFS